MVWRYCDSQPDINVGLGDTVRQWHQKVVQLYSPDKGLSRKCWNFAHSLPKTAYMKMIDIWAIITMAIPFTEVALHTILDLLRKQKEEATNQKGCLSFIWKHVSVFEAISFCFRRAICRAKMGRRGYGLQISGWQSQGNPAWASDCQKEHLHCVKNLLL